MSNQTIAIQIGNTDQKLSTQEWYDYTEDIRKQVKVHADEVHFDGHSTIESPHRNHCWVVVLPKINLNSLKDALCNVANSFKQDSLALTIGETELLHASPCKGS